ncbi:MAG: hypothetical protein HOC71_13180 [Candidatus Latescibacteria bacterium]|nr:hypothetical protein [Candidatus Latescibacterota bacterium]
MDSITTSNDKKKDVTKKLFVYLLGLWFWGMVFGGNLVGLVRATSTERTVTALLIILMSVPLSIYFFYYIINLFREHETGSKIEVNKDGIPEIV